MIVFYCFLIISFIVISFYTSTVEIDVRKVEIKNIDDLKKIVVLIKNKEYYKVFNYIKIKIIIRLRLFSLFPILKFNINNKKIKSLIQKKIESNNRKNKIGNMREYVTDAKNRKYIKKIIVSTKIKKIKLYLNIGTNNAKITAITTGAINSLFYVLVLKIISKNVRVNRIKKNNKKLKKYLNNFLCKVEPMYAEQNAFSLNYRIKFKTPIIAFLIK